MAVPAAQDAGLIIMAAGASSRMGKHKALLTVDGMPLVVWQARRFRRLSPAPIVIVVAPQTVTAVRQALDAQGCAGEMTNLDLVVNPEPTRGAFSSLQIGLGILPGVPVFVTHVDRPLPEPQTMLRLAAELKPGRMVVRPVCHGVGGHPVLLAPEFARILRTLDPADPQARLDLRIAGLPPESDCVVQTDDAGVLLNLNTPLDFAAWLQHRHAGFKNGQTLEEARGCGD